MSASAPRRHLSERQADTVARLTDATVDELRAVGTEQLTVRNVARRAGVAPATAYTYFASREHLVTEVYWQRLRGLPEAEFDATQPVADRVNSVVAAIGLLVADEPALAAACTTALLAGDPEVRRLRDAIGQNTGGRLRSALGNAFGDTATPAVARALDASLSGLMLQAGMGHIEYADISARMGEIVALLLGGAEIFDFSEHSEGALR